MTSKTRFMYSFTYFIHQLFMESVVCVRNCFRHSRYSREYARESACLHGVDMSEEEKVLNEVEKEGSEYRNGSESFEKMLTSVLSWAGSWKPLTNFILFHI